MTGTPTEDPRLLSVAAAIARGELVDWSAIPADNPETTTVLGELRALEGLARVSQPIPDAWGPFEITGELGHGSYGTVYRAFDPDLGLEVALKVLRPAEDLDECGATAALNEARLLAQINHPNVVRIYRAERVGREVGISMELVHGQTLHRLVRSQGPFSANEAMLLGSELCRAVAAVHAARLLHGDIKASNVMRAQGGRTVLMDFGAGHDLKAAADRRARRTAGTPIYLAPEVVAGEPSSVAADIYSIGVLLFYLATGSYPVQGLTWTAVGQQHEAHVPRRLLRDVRPDLPESFIHVVERAIAERPGDRYTTAGELDAALGRALRNEELVPVPPPVPRRWPLAVAAATAVALFGLGYRAWPVGPNQAATQVAAGTVAGPLASATPAPSAAAADAYNVEAAFYRHEGGADVRLQSGARVAKGDELSLRIQSSVPVHAYVVNEDDRGESYLLFPLPDQQLTNPLPAGTRHEIPGIVNGERIRWVVSSDGGREHFLIFVSPQPFSPAFERIFAALDRPALGGPPPLPANVVSMLRGVGGLVKSPDRPSSDTLLSDNFAVPLPESQETARGVWVRQLTLQNPGR